MKKYLIYVVRSEYWGGGQWASWRTFEHGKQVQGPPQEGMPSFGAWRCDASREQVVAQLFLGPPEPKLGKKKLGSGEKLGSPRQVEGQ